MTDEKGLDVSYLCRLYERYATDLRRVRAYQRALYSRHVRMRRVRGAIFRLSGGVLDIGGMGATHRLNGATGIVRMDPGLDDIEAEISYLLLRAQRPDTVVELGASGGWSTTWLLHALRDNGRGSLHSYDIVDFSVGNVPAELADGRWYFSAGDVRDAQMPPSIDYLFIDCDHSREFAEWYLAHLLPSLRPGTPVSIHDIFHPGFVWRFWNFSENTRMGEVPAIKRWLREREIDYFTPSRTWAPEAHRELKRCRDSIGIRGEIHYGFANPMVFLQAP
ncbi:MAG: class I SAM-dependent methyltransferase [Gemmatimonadaceae bacterium]